MKQLPLVILLSLALFLPGAAWAADAQNGKAIFNGPAGCMVCHAVTDENRVGPGLAGAAKRHTDTWLVEWLSNPRKKWQDTDDETLAMKRRFGKMDADRPGMKLRKNLSDQELADLIAYLRTL